MMTPSLRYLAFPACLGVALLSSWADAAPATTRKPTTARKPAASQRKPASTAQKPAPKKPESPVLKHEKFPAFLQLLDKQVADNTPDYGPAVVCMLEATGGDEKALNEWMQAAADAGNAAAERWMLGLVMADIPNDKLLAPEIQAAYKRLVKVADKGYVPAILDVSACQRMGIGTPKDAAAAMKRMEAAAKTGSMLARYQWLQAAKLFTAYADKDKPEVAAEIERGNYYVLYRLASMAPNESSRVQWLKDAATKGSSDAFFAMASISSASKPKESLVLLKEAVQRFNPMALYVYASALIEDNPSNPYVREAGITPDPERGRLLLKAAALLGDVQASLTLANAYYDGALGLPKDPRMAYFHFSNPVIASSSACAAARGLMLLMGNGVEKNAKEGMDLLERAAQSGYAYALILQAYARYKGLDGAADANAAASLLKEAAAVGSPEAYVYLAFLYAKGAEGFPADMSQARRYVRLASIDMGDKAQQLYDSLILKGEWEAHP